jgi:hypothetical protein
LQKLSPCHKLPLFSALNVILKSLNDVGSISELQIAHLKEEIKIIPGFEAASLNIKIRRQIEIKIVIEYISVYRQTRKLTTGEMFVIIYGFNRHRKSRIIRDYTRFSYII